MSPAPSRPIREPGGVKGKPSPSNPDSEVRMMPPPPPKRPATRGERAVAATGSSFVPAAPVSTYLHSDNQAPVGTMIKRLQKRLRQIQLLKKPGRPLNLEERVKVAEQPIVERDLAALLSTPTRTRRGVGPR